MSTVTIARLLAFGLLLALVVVVIYEAIWRRRFMERMKQDSVKNNEEEGVSDAQT